MRSYIWMLLLISCDLIGQQGQGQLSIDRLYSNEFQEEFMPAYQWVDNGNSYLMVKSGEDHQSIELYETASGKKTILIDQFSWQPNDATGDVPRIESVSMSEDETKVLLFHDSKRVWRSNTKGNYTVFDKDAGEGSAYKRLGQSLESSSLMFAKFSPNNEYAAYVSDFNIYLENFSSGEIIPLTKDGSTDIINGTFDWVYEEEFGCRDGFRWSPDSKYISFWQLDASTIGTHHMINNTDSVYPRLIPLQYPKVGQDPSSCKVGLINIETKKMEWIPVPGDHVQNYIPRMQWINPDLLMIQQINRKQNHLIYWNYNPHTKKIKKVYEEREDTWVDIDYPDVSSSTWGMYDLSVIDDVWVTRMKENDSGWRHALKINLETGEKQLLTPGAYDVATTYAQDGSSLFFSASPDNSTQRYLYKVGLDGNGAAQRLTPKEFSGINKYDISPNGKYAFHTHSNASTPRTTRLIKTDNHKEIRNFVSNEKFSKSIASLDLGTPQFFQVTTEDGVTIDGRMLLPKDFDETKKYPVLFHVYGEPWGQVAQDTWIGLWDHFITQQGYIIIDMDNRGTPCLLGSEWRKSIYRQIGRINANDQAAAAKEVLKWDFIDETRTGVWGWSGGGSMTLNLMFRFADIYTTGVSVAPVGNQLLYDNIYQERYMGLPYENLEDFLDGSPVKYAHLLKGNLLLVHGTGDDNVHYQNAEVIINELIKHNRPFDMMAYPNRAHGIYEGRNTRKHLYGLITRYILEHIPAGPK